MTSTRLVTGDAFEGIQANRNYLGGSSFELGLTPGWATYADAAGTTPVDGTGGSPNVTFTAVSGATVRGTFSGRLTKDAADRQGQGASYDFTIDAADTGRPLSIAFDFLASANYVANDVGVYIYDVTNATLITPAAVNVAAGKGTFKAFFVATTSTSYRLILHVASTNASAWTLDTDNFQVGPQVQLSGVAVTDWQAYTPTITGLGSKTADVNIAYWRRVGDTLEARGLISTNLVAAGAGGTSFLFTIPPGLSFDTTKVGNQTNVGWANTYGILAATQFDRQTELFTNGTSSFAMFKPGTATNLTQNDFDNTNEQEIHWFVNVPIANWSSNTTSLTAADPEFASNSNTADADDTTSFVNGASGSSLPGTLTTKRRKRIQFQTPIQPTDTFDLEFSPTITGPWTKLNGSTSPGLYDIQFVSGVSGAIIERTGSTNQVTVAFERYASGSTNWSTAGGFWRVRKQSGLTQGILPVGARNVVGDTSGTAVPSGFIGERLTNVNQTTNNAAANTVISSGTVTLTPGVYDLFGMAGAQSFGTLSGANAITVAVRDASATSFSGTVQADNQLFCYVTGTGGGGISVGPWRVNVSTTTQYHAVGSFAATSGTGTLYLRIIANRVA